MKPLYFCWEVISKNIYQQLEKKALLSPSTCYSRFRRVALVLLLVGSLLDSGPTEGRHRVSFIHEKHRACAQPDKSLYPVSFMSSPSSPER